MKPTEKQKELLIDFILYNENYIIYTEKHRIINKEYIYFLTKDVSKEYYFLINNYHKDMQIKNQYKIIINDKIEINEIIITYRNFKPFNITDKWIKFLRKKKLEELRRNETN